ncbi:hypothetical protein JCM9279_006102 [Rhodotorula babjevae]
MSSLPSTPTRAGAASTSSSLVSPPPSRRRPALSPLSTVQGSSPANSFRSHRPPESVSGLSLAPSRFTLSNPFPRPPTGSPSLAGSTATGAHAGSTRFRRGHVRKRPGHNPPPAPGAAQAALASANPDEVDLMALEEPDDVFRSFGVRDVRRIEQRASDAAAAKVAELRTMVGERYRDLLSAADSIVRMRSAADKLVGHLDSVGQAVREAGAAVDGPSPNRGKAPQAPRHRPNSPSRQRTLGSSATLSLTIHLLLTIPSLVHTLLETSDFLPAARLEDLGRLVYRELAEHELPPEDGGDDGDAPRRLAEAFPIVEKQWETLSTLRPVVLRRAVGQLQSWDAPHLDTARTLAATVMLQQGASVSSALSTLLDARSRALSAILDGPSTSAQAFNETSAVARRLEQVLGLVLRTVEAVSAIFGSASDEQAPGLLRQLLAEVERPTAPEDAAVRESDVADPSLPPVLVAFPNYATLQRHLPPSILTYAPPVATSAAREPLAAPDVARTVDAWLARESDRVVEGVTAWIASLSSQPASAKAVGSNLASAKPLAVLRTTLRRATTPSPTSCPSSSRTAATTLRTRLSRVLESRLAHVYRARLSALSARVAPSLAALLLALPDGAGDADRDAAAFLFETPLAFPGAGAYAAQAALALSGRAAGAGAAAEKDKDKVIVDPLEAFLAKVAKRVEGRAPLVDRGLVELEDAARELRADLESWLGGSGSAVEREGEGAGDEKVELRARLWRDYVEAAGEALGAVADALEGVVSDVAQDVDGALFVGNFVFLLSSSRTFVRDLLLGAASSAEASLLNKWQSRLGALQDRSLEAWREQAVAAVVRKLQESMSTVAAAAPSATLWAWDASRAENPPSPLVPSSPSSALLSALRSLSASLARVGLHRTQASPCIASSLLAAFADQVLGAAAAFAEQLTQGDLQEDRKAEVASQVAWDLALLRRLVLGGEGGGEEKWREVEGSFLRLVSPSSDALSSQLASSALAYLQRTQSILAPLLPVASSSSLGAVDPSTTTTTIAVKHKPLSSTARLLPLGAPVASADVKATGVGLVKPGPRLGLLPTRG